MPEIPLGEELQIMAKSFKSSESHDEYKSNYTLYMKQYIDENGDVEKDFDVLDSE